MADQQVPWARARRALVLDVCHTRGWVECVGVDTDDGEPAWEASGLDEVGDVIPDRWLGTLCPAELLPDQCPRCYATGNGEHAPGCMVAANLEKGVPAFWAPFAMWVFPDEEAGRDLYIGCGGNVERLYVLDGDGVWLLDGEPIAPGTTMESLGSGFDGQWLVSLGPNGPTLAPWGLG